MTNPPHGDPPPGEPRRPQPQQPWPQQPGPWGPPAPGPYGGQPPQGQPPYWVGQPQPGQPQHGQPPYGQPQHGQPPYGQPPYGPPAPQRRSRRALVAGIVVPAVLLLVAVVLARVFADTVLDTGRVEDDVAAQFEEIEGVAIDLTCDDEMQVEQGADYECTGTTADGEEVTLRIVITDETDASYTWEEV
ncbi:DUF4333 domain-containing protein [Geodermatophilus poikilotrophus]|uniref:DUF4333 domain-containing protein n=1 Tax=Geodermatophilus poikilotrophus TaxID=1333667 RepID=UPI000B8097E8|nr:DUF4333 domain-containing protein [Geodermatophilus poikilotrophus]